MAEMVYIFEYLSVCIFVSKYGFKHQILLVQLEMNTNFSILSLIAKVS